MFAMVKTKDKEISIKLSLIKLPVIHPTLEKMDYSHKFDVNYKFIRDDYLKKIANYLKDLKEQCNPLTNVNLQIVIPESKLNFRLVFIFIYQIGGERDHIFEILTYLGIDRAYTFSPRQIGKMCEFTGDGIKIDINKMERDLAVNGLELGRHELRYFLEILQELREQTGKASVFRYANHTDGLFLGWDNLNRAVTVDRDENMILFGDDNLIPPIIHNKQFQNTVIVSQNRDFFIKYKNIGAPIRILSAGNGIEIYTEPEDYNSTFSINLIKKCREDLGFSLRFFNYLRILLNASYKDPNMMYTLISTIINDPIFKDIEIHFKDLLRRDVESDPYWQDTDLRPLAGDKSKIDNIFGPSITKPYFQLERGEIDGITVIDTSELSDIDHTLICLYFLAHQQSKHEYYLILSDIDVILDNLFKQSDFDKIIQDISPYKLILHFNHINDIKSWYKKFNYQLINRIDHLDQEAMKKLRLVEIENNEFIILDRFDEFTIFKPTELLPVIKSRVIKSEISKLQEINVEITESNENISILDEYIIGALIAFLSTDESIFAMKLFDIFIKVEGVELALDEMIKQDIITFGEDKYVLNYRFRNSIEELIKRVEAEENDDTPLSELLLNMSIEFLGASFDRRKQLTQNLIKICEYISNAEKSLLVTYYLSIGLYREMLDKKEANNNIYHSIFSNITSIILISNENEDLNADIDDLNTSIDIENIIDYDVLQTVEEFDEIEEEIERERERIAEAYAREQLGMDDVYEENITDENEVDKEEKTDALTNELSLENEVDKDTNVEEQIVIEENMTSILSKPIQQIDTNISKIDILELKERFVVNENRGWIPSDIDYNIKLYQSIPFDIFVLTFEILKQRTRNEREKNIPVNMSQVEFVRDRLMVDNTAMIEDLIKHKMCRMRKKGLVFNNFKNIFKNRLGGENIGEDEYRKIMKEFPEINKDDIIEFINNPDWIDYLINEKNQIGRVKFKHYMLDHIRRLWAVSHYDSAFNHIDAILMGMINLPDMDMKYIDMLLVYFRMMRLSESEKLDEDYLYRDVIVGENMKNQMYKIFISITNSRMEIPRVNLTAPQSRKTNEIKEKNRTRKHAALEQLKEISEQIKKAKEHDIDEEILIDNIWIKELFSYQIDRFQINKQLMDNLPAPIIEHNEKKIIDTRNNKIATNKITDNSKSSEKKVIQDRVYKAHHVLNISENSEDIKDASKMNVKELRYELKTKFKDHYKGKSKSKKAELIEILVKARREKKIKDNNKFKASGKNFIDNMENYIETSESVGDLSKYSENTKRNVHPLDTDLVKSIKSINHCQEPMNYLHKVLIRMISGIIKQEIDIDRIKLIGILNKAGTEAKVAVNSFTSNISEIQIVYNNGDEEIKQNTVDKLRDKIYLSVDQLNYDDSFVLALKKQIM